MPDISEVFDYLRQFYRIGYCGLFDRSTHLSLYIQTTTKRARICPPKILGLLAPFGAVGMPATYGIRDGMLLAERGNFRSVGAPQKRAVDERATEQKAPNSCKCKRPSEQETVLLTESEVDESGADIREQKAPKRKRGQDDDDPQYVPVYSGFNRNWKIESWNLYKKDFKRKSSKPFREIVLKRQDYRCNYCRCDINFGEYSNADMDHAVGLHAGGQNVLHNVQALCVPCHRKKSGLESRRVSIALSAIIESACVPGTNEPLCQSTGNTGQYDDTITRNTMAQCVI